MKPAAFDYIRPETLTGALEALHQAGDEARVLAGGQSLVAMLNMRLARPSLLVDVMKLGANTIVSETSAVTVPFGVRQAELAAYPSLATHLPLVHAMLPWLGHAQTRARGTVCGSVAHADPSAELPLALVALDGRIRLRARRSKRTVAARDFFNGMMLTDLKPGEMIDAVSFPKIRPGQGHGFAEVGRRKGDFAIVSCAAIIEGKHVRLSVGGVEDTPALRDWDSLDDGQIDDALNEFAWSLEARDDLHATARYRRDLVRRLGRKTIEEARKCVR